MSGKGRFMFDIDGFAHLVAQALREPRHLSLTEAAGIIGVSKATIFRVLHKQPVSVENALILSSWLEADLLTFLVDRTTGEPCAPRPAIAISPDVSREVDSLRTSRGARHEYSCWRAMIQRCVDRRHEAYRHYGGRGVQVCDRWLFGDERFKDGFECFLDDMGSRPSSGHSIERIENDGDYEPSNCRWATQTEQNRNTRKNLMVTYLGKRVCISEAAEMAGGVVSGQLAAARLRRGWGVEEAIEIPAARSKASA